jgi:hypothetical protein
MICQSVCQHSRSSPLGSYLHTAARLGDSTKTVSAKPLVISAHARDFRTHSEMHGPGLLVSMDIHVEREADNITGQGKERFERVSGLNTIDPPPLPSTG